MKDRAVWILVLALIDQDALALDLQVTDKAIVDFLPWLAEESGHSLILSPEVNQHVTISAKDMSWRDLVAAIAHQSQLSLQWQGETALIGMQPEVDTSEICRTQFWKLNHAKAKTVGEQLKALFSEPVITEDERTNTLVTYSCHDSNDLQQTIRWLDNPVRQVEISARIAQVRSSVESQLGVNWQGELGGGMVSTASGVAELNSIASTSSLSFAVTKGERLLSLTLDVLESEGNANIVSEPRVVTSEGKAARIESGTEIPYQTRTDDDIQVAFKEAGLVLEVTPFVRPGKQIQLELTIHQDSVGELYNGIPSLETNRLHTQVLVEDQQTLILGGIYRDEWLSSVSKVPWLGDLPVVGGLFRRQIERQEKVELLVFITPKLLQMSDN